MQERAPESPVQWGELTISMNLFKKKLIIEALVPINGSDEIF